MAQRFRYTERCKQTFFHLVFDQQKHANFDAKQGKNCLFCDFVAMFLAEEVRNISLTVRTPS
jgi:hypothetical protein